MNNSTPLNYRQVREMRSDSSIRLVLLDYHFLLLVFPFRIKRMNEMNE